MIRPALVTTLLGLTGAAQAQAPVAPQATPPMAATTTTTITTTTATPASPGTTDKAAPLPPPRVAPGPAAVAGLGGGAESGPGAQFIAPPPPPAPRPSPRPMMRRRPPMAVAGQPVTGYPGPAPYGLPRGYPRPLNMDMVPPPPPPPPALPVPPPPPPQLVTAYGIDPANAAVPDTVPPLPIDRARAGVIGPRVAGAPMPAPDMPMTAYPWPPTEDMPVPPDAAMYPPAYPVPAADGVAPPARPGRDRAGRDTTTLDLFASRLRLDPGGTDQLGDTTLGGRARIGVAPNLFVTGEYQKNGFDEANGRFDLRQVRAGLGARFLVARGLPSVWGTVEYTDWRLRDRFTNAFNRPQDVIEDVRGPGLHAGTRIPLGPVVGLYGEGGYVWMRDGTYTVRGPEWLGGVDLIPLASRFGSLRLFAEYRYSDMNLDFRDPGTAQARGVPASNDLKLGDFRAGARIGLGR